MGWWWRSETPRSAARSIAVAWPPRTACRWSGGRASQAFRRPAAYAAPTCSSRCAHTACRTSTAITSTALARACSSCWSIVCSGRHPGLIVAGYSSPPYRPLTAAEDVEDIAAINEARPDFVWVGLGMPKQEKWMVEHLGQIEATALIGIGAAFDFHAGTKPRAPIWMQRSGLEWLFRLMTEPRRLAHRYLIDNALFIAYMLQQVTGWTAHARG